MVNIAERTDLSEHLCQQIAHKTDIDQGFKLHCIICGTPIRLLSVEVPREVYPERPYCSCCEDHIRKTLATAIALFECRYETTSKMMLKGLATGDWPAYKITKDISDWLVKLAQLKMFDENNLCGHVLSGRDSSD